jgi:hypothetical protein
MKIVTSIAICFIGFVLIFQEPPARSEQLNILSNVTTPESFTYKKETTKPINIDSLKKITEKKVITFARHYEKVLVEKKKLLTIIDTLKNKIK